MALDRNRIIGPNTLPPDAFARPKPPPAPSLEERQVKALEDIGRSLQLLVQASERQAYRQTWR